MCLYFKNSLLSSDLLFHLESIIVAVCIRPDQIEKHAFVVEIFIVFYNKHHKSDQESYGSFN